MQRILIDGRAAYSTSIPADAVRRAHQHPRCKPASLRLADYV